MTERDRLGLWYELLEREQGEYMVIRFGRAPLDGGDPEWMDVPHKDYDGIGALWEIHRRCYGEDGAGPMPTLRQPDPPGFVEGWRDFLRFMSRPRAPAAAWRCFDPSWRGRSPETSKPETLCWRVLSPEQTRAVVARAKAEGVSVNTLLLWALGRAIEPALDLERGAVRWMVPVNMRGAVRRPRATSNHSSYVRAETPPGGGPRDVERTIREALARREHFAAWRGARIGAALGPWYLRRFYAEEVRQDPLWVGMFTNLGVWPERADSGGTGDAWLVGATVTRIQPLGASALTWRGRLALTMQTHPSLRVDRAEVCRWLDAWIGGSAPEGVLVAQPCRPWV